MLPESAGMKQSYDLFEQTGAVQLVITERPPDEHKVHGSQFNNQQSKPFELLKVGFTKLVNPLKKLKLV